MAEQTTYRLVGCVLMRNVLNLESLNLKDA